MIIPQTDALAHVADIIKSLSDPQAAAKRLQEIKTAADKNAAVLEQTKKIATEADAKLDKAHELHTAAMAKAAENDAKEKRLANLANELDERARALAEREEEIANWEHTHAPAIAERHAALETRANELATAEKKLDAERARIAADRKALNEHMEQARRFLKV